MSGTLQLGAVRVLFCAFCATATLPAVAQSPEPAAILNTYADIAHAEYSDALTTARALDAAIDRLIAEPTEPNLILAREAWKAARVPYQQTEAYRFGNPLVDDWEGRVNAWPLDEGLIDYVDASYGSESDENGLYTANVIANTTIMINGREVDASHLTPDFLANTLQEAGGIETNVATGYHAIEFLLWGQDLNGTGPGAGNRPASDFDPQNCTGGHCDRRAQYLKSASELLVTDLEEMVANWEADGAARHDLLANGGLGLPAIIKGIGSLTYGELAGQRMKVGLLLHDPEEEHDCFSDTTAVSYFNDVVGIQNVYLGRYKQIDGTMVEGPSISDYAASLDPDLDKELRNAIENSLQHMAALVERSQTTEAYDQMIGEANTKGNAMVQAAIDALLVQTRAIERVTQAIGFNVQIDDDPSLSGGSGVFQ